jgi:hypothetical protein
MVYSKGICWLDDTRIPFVDEGDNNTTRDRYDTNIYINHNSKLGVGSIDDSAKQGRFTPNLLVCDDMLNDGHITGGKDFNIQNTKEQTIYGGGKGFISKEKRHIKQDKGSNSRYYDIDLWFNQLLNKLT